MTIAAADHHEAHRDASCDKSPSQHTMPTSSSKAPPARAHRQFLFVDSPAPTVSADEKRKDRQNVRSFLMRQARQERAWSTSKGSRSAFTQHDADVRAADLTVPCPKSAPLSDADAVAATTVAARRLHSISLDSCVRGRRGQLLERRLTVSPPPCLDLQRRTEECAQCQRVRQHDSIWCKRCLNKRRLDPVLPLGVALSEHLDPFGALPINIDKRSSSSLHYWLNVWSETSNPILSPFDTKGVRTYKSGAISTALESEIALLATIYSGKVHSYVAGQTSLVEVMRWKSMVIQQLNRSMRVPGQSCNDGIIQAVFNVLVAERTLQLPEFQAMGIDTEEKEKQYQVHLAGLGMMIRMRGGIAGLKSRWLATYLVWYTTAMYVSNLDRPAFDVYEFEPSLSPLQAHLAKNRPRCLGLDGLLVHDELTIAVEHFAHLSLEFHDWFENPKTRVDPFDLVTRTYINQCRVMDWYRHSESGAQQCLAIAFLVFFLRLTDFAGRQTLVVQAGPLHRLQNALESLVQDVFADHRPALLWILVTGGICAIGSPQLPWFAKAFRHTCYDFRVVSFDKLLTHLQTVMWLDSRLKSAAQAFWQLSMEVGQNVGEGVIVELPDFLQENVFPRQRSSKKQPFAIPRVLPAAPDSYPRLVGGEDREMAL